MKLREALREDPGIWYDLGQALLILCVIVVCVVGTVRCCS